MDDWHLDGVYIAELLRLPGSSSLEGPPVFGYESVHLSNYFVGGHWHYWGNNPSAKRFRLWAGLLALRLSL